MQRIEVSPSAPMSVRAQGSISEFNPGTNFTTGDIFPAEQEVPPALVDVLDRMGCLKPVEQTGKKHRRREYKKEFDPRKDGIGRCLIRECVYVASCPMSKSATGLSDGDDSQLGRIVVK